MNKSHSCNKDVSKQLEYVKQQQQLRAIGNIHDNTGSKSLSAERMIEDLLSKKETFQKRVPDSQQKQETPGWVASPHYERVWAGVQSAGGLADTSLLSSLLMSSGLSTDTLGYIWSLANRTVPGALTQPEVYLVLALVGLAQTGYVVNNLAALNQLPQAPIPTLDLTLLPSGSHVYPNPLSVTNLPDQLTFNWVTPDTVHPSSSEKIGISYVGSGPMVSPNLLTEHVTKASNLNSTDLGVNNNTADQQNVMPNNSIINITFGDKPNEYIKHSTNTYSFSFPSLNESPSHCAETKHEDDPFDDEFTDFQSADCSSATNPVKIQTHLNSVIDDEDEFTNFQKASPTYENDDLSVLVIGGRNIPSAQNLWVADSPAITIGPEKFNRLEAERKGNYSNVLNTWIDKNSGDAVHTEPIAGKIDHSENISDAFQEIKDDKYSVFHNPLSDDDDKLEVESTNIIQNVHMETKSIFNHSLFDNPEPSLDLFKTDHQTPTLELPKLDAKDSDGDDDEYSNFQNFPVSFQENGTALPVEHVDKYDIFRTIIFEDSASRPIINKQAKTEMPLQKLTHIQSTHDEMDVLTNVENYQQGGYNKFSDTSVKQNVHNIKFGDFQESVAITSSEDSNIHNLFSSLAISEKMYEKETKHDVHVTSDPGEDKYKALRLLESDTDDFGEFLGAELPSSGSEPKKNLEQSSIQVRCLEACLNLLKAGLATLSRASSQEVVSEILSDPRANTYLDCLLEIHRVSERIIAHMERSCCTPIIAELHQVWTSLTPYFSHTEHNHLTDTVGAVCGVCRSNTGPSSVTFGALSFHTPCANLYLHCVEPVLPNITAPTTVQ